ncbi:MAG: desaturase [Rhodospirillaceae bacterium]|nr:desaturase [Rhodospirillaceae bacterium]
MLLRSLPWTRLAKADRELTIKHPIDILLFAGHAWVYIYSRKLKGSNVMSDATLGERNARGEWRPEAPIALAPINHWPPHPSAILRWCFGNPGYIWPYNALWLAIAVATWAWLTPELAIMKTLELWWMGLILARNIAFIVLLFGGLHLYFYVLRGQGDAHRFNTEPLATNSRRFLFRNQVRDNMARTLVFGVPVFTSFEIATYWGFANGYLGFPGLVSDPVLFWGWFVVALLFAPVIHAVHFYLGHRLLHVRFLYKTVHALHHRNVEIGPWSGLAMHPVEHVIYFSTVCVQWLIALHPVNALFQIQIAAFYPALGHSGFERLKIGDGQGLEGGSYFHYLHHKHFECNYGGSLVPLDKWFGTFHDGTPEAHALMRERLRERRVANA